MNKIIDYILIALCITIPLIIWYNYNLFIAFISFWVLVWISFFLRNRASILFITSVCLTFILSFTIWKYYSFFSALITFFIMICVSAGVNKFEESRYRYKYGRTPMSSYEDKLTRDEKYDYHDYE